MPSLSRDPPRGPPPRKRPRAFNGSKNPLEELKKQFKQEKAEWEKERLEWEEEKQELEAKIVGLELQAELKRREEDPSIPPTLAILNSTLHRVENAHRVSFPSNHRFPPTCCLLAYP